MQYPNHRSYFFFFFLIKVKYVTQELAWSTVVLQSCPGLQILFYRCRKTCLWVLFGTDPDKCRIIMILIFPVTMTFGLQKRSFPPIMNHVNHITIKTHVLWLSTSCLCLFSALFSAHLITGKKKKKTSSDTPSLLQGVERRVWVGFCEVFIWAANPWPPWGKDLLVSVCLHSHLACSLHSSFLFPVTFRSVLRFCFFGVFLLSSKCFLGFSLTGLFFFASLFLSPAFSQPPF